VIVADHISGSGGQIEEEVLAGLGRVVQWHQRQRVRNTRHDKARGAGYAAGMMSSGTRHAKYQPS
jgi:hypothetical protein